eukprot:scaffold533_cov369-Prasinococcus_capsulatus_cf.AAC.20
MDARDAGLGGAVPDAAQGSARDPSGALQRALFLHRASTLRADAATQAGSSGPCACTARGGASWELTAKGVVHWLR